MYGLAGLRIGYAFAAPDVADLMNRVREPFNVNGVGLAAAAAALDDLEFVARSYDVNRSGMQQLAAGLTGLGLEFIRSYGNFVTFAVADAQQVFQRLLEAIGPWWSVAVLSAIFGAIHLGNPNAGGIRSWGFFNTIVVGALFAYAYLRTKTLWLPVGMHFGWNFFLGVVYGLPVSGIHDFSVVIKSTAHGSKLLTGGPYGIEASLTGAVVIVIGFVLVAWAPKPQNDPIPQLQEPTPSI